MGTRVDELTEGERVYIFAPSRREGLPPARVAHMVSGTWLSHTRKDLHITSARRCMPACAYMHV